LPQAVTRPDEPEKPITLGNMRDLGLRDLHVTCRTCGYRTTINVDFWPDEATVLSLGQQLRCRRCGHQGVDVQLDWMQWAPGM
jgi:ribosomal protein L37E